LACSSSARWGLILSAAALRKEPRGLAIAGLVLGLIGTAILLAVMIFFGGIGVGIFTLVKEYRGAIEVHTNVQQFYQANGRLPADLNELTTKYPGTTITDRRGNTLGYRVNSPTTFVVILPGKDGVVGTQDDTDLDGEVGGPGPGGGTGTGSGSGSGAGTGRTGTTGDTGAPSPPPPTTDGATGAETPAPKGP